MLKFLRFVLMQRIHTIMDWRNARGGANDWLVEWQIRSPCHWVEFQTFVHFLDESINSTQFIQWKYFSNISPDISQIFFQIFSKYFSRYESQKFIYIDTCIWDYVNANYRLIDQWQILKKFAPPVIDKLI